MAEEKKVNLKTDKKLYNQIITEKKIEEMNGISETCLKTNSPNHVQSEHQKRNQGEKISNEIIAENSPESD